jgi:hypothetical protein
MNQRLRVPLSVGDRVVFKSPLNEHWMQLESFFVSAERIEWKAKLSNGQLIEGRIRDQVTMSQIKGSWVCLAIPVIVHTYKKNSIDFMFCLPTSYRAEVQAEKELES